MSSNCPNILFLMTDQQRWDAMGCSGNWVKTPNLDRIAAEGVRFANAVTNTPVCIPARVTMATGLYPHNTGIWNNCRHDMSPDSRTWMQVLRDLGYRTSLFGKTHLHHHSGDLREREHLLHAYGIDDVDEIGGPRASARVGSHMTARWEAKGLWQAYQDDYAERFSNMPHVVRPSVLPLNEYADVYVGQQARSYLAAYDRDAPWCCWVSFGGPHEPWDTPEPFARLHNAEAMPRPVPKAEWRHDGRPRGKLDEMLANNPALTPEDIARCRADYAGNVALIDDQIGALLEILEARGELDNTIITFTSDHGELNGDYGRLYKSTFLDGCVRVPFLVRTPKTASKPDSRRVCTSPTEWMDMGATVVDLAGGSLEYTQFARSVVPCLADPAHHHRSEAISEIDGEVMLLDEEWKCALNRTGEIYMLFDVRKDPQEQNNLAGLPELNEVETALRLRILERLMVAQLG